jgi:hypothetical protein
LSDTIETAAFAFPGLSKFSVAYYDPRIANFQPPRVYLFGAEN